MGSTVPETWLNVEETAELLKIHPNTVRRAIKEKKLRAMKVGKGWRITQEAIDEYVVKSSNMSRAA